MIRLLILAFICCGTIEANIFPVQEVSELILPIKITKEQYLPDLKTQLHLVSATLQLGVEGNAYSKTSHELKYVIKNISGRPISQLFGVLFNGGTQRYEGARTIDSQLSIVKVIPLGRQDYPNTKDKFDSDISLMVLSLTVQGGEEKSFEITLKNLAPWIIAEGPKGSTWGFRTFPMTVLSIWSHPPDHLKVMLFHDPSGRTAELKSSGELIKDGYRFIVSPGGSTIEKPAKEVGERKMRAFRQWIWNRKYPREDIFLYFEDDNSKISPDE